MNKYFIILSILFLGFIMITDYMETKNNCIIPQFTKEEMQQICIEEGLK